MNESAKNFAIIGAAGYIAPRHMEAIRATGHRLLAALDINDSVGILDSFFPNASFFTEFERFDRHLEKLKRLDKGIDYLVVCSPNYLHDAHIRYGLRMGIDIICEKPIVLNPWNISSLREIEIESGKKVWSILQLRHHNAIIKLKEKVDRNHVEYFDINLTYITARGLWYYASWKGNEEKSGGVLTNIGIHFFDILLWIFGELKELEVHCKTHDRAAGILFLERGKVTWFLSINEQTLPKEIRQKGQRTYRSLTLNNDDFEFSSGFENLHTTSYQGILQGNGFPLSETEAAINLVHKIRTSKLSSSQDMHPFAKIPLAKHPFLKSNYQD